MENEIIEKSGSITDIIYYNDENSYTVAVVENEEAQEQFTIVGYMPGIGKGRHVKLKGQWKHHPSYGDQFAIQDYSEELPTDAAGIESFLASGTLKGVGPKTARIMMDKFGTKVLEIIQDTPHRLTEISGIGTARAQMITESFALHREFAQIALFFQKYDISTAYAKRIYKVYGADTIKQVQENPYRLADEIFGVGFKKADKLAEKLGIARDSTDRIRCGIQYVLMRMALDGHTFYPKKFLVEHVTELLEISEEQTEEQLTEMALDGDIYLESLQKRIVVFLPSYAYAEKNVTKQLMMLSREKPKPIQTDVDDMIRKVEVMSGVILSDNQRKAVRTAVTSSVCVITGGPGTGKTTTINSVIHVFENCGLNTAIAAPTGRAAKRITETTGREAKTIHRLLEYSFSESGDSMTFGKNKDNPLEVDAVIVDEASMIDILLMNGLVSAMSYGTRLIIVGDADQLPPVGAGSVLRDILSSDMLTTIKLTEIFRQAKESMIVVNAHQINRGEYPSCNGKGTDFFLLRKSGERAILDTIKELCINRLPMYFEDTTPADIQILTPMRKGLLGSINLNKQMQELLNPPSANAEEKAFKDKIFRQGDRVMQIKNNYEIEWRQIDDYEIKGQGVFNGDLGIISSIDNEDGIISVLYDEKRFVRYDIGQLEELELAYAITVHKSQGSEFPMVVMPMTWFPPMLANRNLLYTAVTRAKRAVVLIGSENALMGMVDNNKILERYCGLDVRLKEFVFT